MKYLFDTNVFITAKNTYYAMDIVKSFWKCLEQDVINNKILIIDKVYEEIIKGNDELATWVIKIFSDKIISSNKDTIIKNYSEIIDLIAKKEYSRKAQDEFARVADSWLIAHAYNTDHCIITNEKYDPNIKRKIQIPNICNLFNISHMDLFQFMRSEEIIL